MDLLLTFSDMDIILDCLELRITIFVLIIDIFPPLQIFQIMIPQPPIN